MWNRFEGAGEASAFFTFGSEVRRSPARLDLTDCLVDCLDFPNPNKEK